jgi:AcrB/AcrD/AcrF family
MLESGRHLHPAQLLLTVETVRKPDDLCHASGAGPYAIEPQVDRTAGRSGVRISAPGDSRDWAGERSRFFIQDRAGKSVDYLWQNTQNFLETVRNRLELARMNLTFSPSVPRMFAAVDKDKVFKLGVSIDDVYRALPTLLAGYYVNQFIRFGRVWKVFVEAEPQYRTRATNVGQFYVRNKEGGMIPPSTLVNMQRAFRPEFITRFNEHRSIEIFAQPASACSNGSAMSAPSPRSRIKSCRATWVPHGTESTINNRSHVAASSSDLGRASSTMTSSADWIDHADRIVGKERNPDCRVHEGGNGEKRLSSRPKKSVLEPALESEICTRTRKRRRQERGPRDQITAANCRTVQPAAHQKGAS